MPINCYPDDISLRFLKSDLKNYSWAALRQDASAAISVALLTIPQAMAYALLAGLPVSCGLLAAIYSSLIAAIFSSSRHLVAGPSNAMAILVQAGTAEILFTYFRDIGGYEKHFVAIQILTQLTLLIGILQVLAAACKLGRLTQFVSHSVIVGYIAGTAIAIVVNQFYTFLGISRMPGVHSLYERASYLMTHLHQAHIPTTLIGISCLFLLIIFKRVDKRIPGGVISIAYAGIVVYLMDFTFYSVGVGSGELEEQAVSTVMMVRDTGEVSGVVPNFAFPFFNPSIMNEMLPIAFALALLSMMETTSVAKSIAGSSGQRLSLNQDIFGIGLGNLISSLTGAMPVSGSPSRSSMNYSSGAQTRFAAVLNALFVAICIYAFGFLVTRIPLTALSALLLFSVTNIINLKQLLICLKATSSDAFVLWVTLLSCVFFSLDIAFYIGVALSITLYLKKAAIPQLVEYDIDATGELKNLEEGCSEMRKIRIIKVEGELFFGAADLFQATLKSIAEDDNTTRVIILQLKNARDIDATACLAIQQLDEFLKQSGRQLIACGITAPVWEVLSDSGVVEQLGKENLFVFDERHPHQFLQKALHRAQEFCASSVNKLSGPIQQPEALEMPIFDSRLI